MNSRLEALLVGLDRERLHALLARLVQRDPSLLQTIESELGVGQGTAVGAQHSVPPPDLHAARRQMTAALRHPPVVMDRGWRMFHLGPEASQILEQVWTLIRAGEGRAAMDMLNVITDECMDSWQDILEDEEGETLTFVQEELGPAWTEAILSADLTPNEREGWEAKIDVWASELAEYMGSENWEVVQRALTEGWDDPELRRILRGETAHREILLFESDDDSDIRARLTVARLNVLERQERYDEYLNLARAEGQVARYGTMLVRRGQAAAAADYGLENLQSATDALTVAEALREAGDMEEAIRVAQRGLELEGRKGDLGTWLANLAASLGAREIAFHAATAAFLDEESLMSYLRVQELADDAWPAHREELLAHLRQGRDFYLMTGPIDIFLHEGLVDDAIALLDRSSYPAPTLIRQVADAAVDVNPDWVIVATRKQAERIMDAKKAEKYGEAANLLSIAKKAYAAAGREDEWQVYLSNLLDHHHRKYRLVPLLQGLRTPRSSKSQ